MGVQVRGHTIQVAVDLVTEECCNCGILFAITRNFKDEKLKYRHSSNRKTFYCPNGHPQFYTGETEEQKLKRELAQAEKDKAWYERNYTAQRKRADHERARANGYKGHATRITKRAKAGVCPCCNRTFKQLAQHMQTQHPEFTPLVLQEEPAL